MSKGAYAATATDSIIVTAETHANAIEIQWHSGDPGFLGFGEAGVVDEGIKIWSGAPYYQIRKGDPKLLQDIHMICDTLGTQAGGYQVT